MSQRCGRSARHTVSVAAPASVVYGLLADAPRWPLFLPSCVHAERLAADARTDRLTVWTAAGGHVRRAQLRRTLRPAERTVDFEETTAEPGPGTVGTWSVEPEHPRGDGRSALTLHCAWPRPAPDGDPLAPARLVRRRLAQVRDAAERWDTLDESLLSFANSTRVEGPPELVYDLLYRAEDWADLLPHVDGARVREERPGVQHVALDLGDPLTGEPVTATSVRLCFPHAGRIVHKASAGRGPVAAHSGEWSLEPDASGLTVTSTHHVLLRPAADAGAARLRVREWLTGTDRETLDLIKWHAESPVPRLR